MFNQIIILFIIVYIAIGLILFLGAYNREQDEKKELLKEVFYIIINWVNMLYFIQGLTHNFGNKVALDIFKEHYKRKGLVIWGRNMIYMIRN